MTKKDINDLALKIAKEVIKDKKYKSLTEGVIGNTSEKMTEEQVKRVLEEVNKKVFTMIYNERDNKDFKFDIALIEDVLKAKKYKKIGSREKVLSASSKYASMNSIDSDIKLEEFLKAASYILGDSQDGNCFGIEAYNKACAIIFDSVSESEEIKTASKILDIMRRSKRLLNSQDKSIESFLTKKKIAYNSIIEATKEANLDPGMAFNTISRVLPNYMMLKKSMDETSDEVKNSGMRKIDFFKNYASKKIPETFIHPMT